MQILENDFAEKMKQELSALWRFSLRLAADTDDASELVQRTCARALEQRESYNDNVEFQSWIFRIQHRVWLNEMRPNKARSDRSIDFLKATVEPSDDVRVSWVRECSEHVAESDSCLTQVGAAIEQLPEAQRIILFLVFAEGLSYRLAADVLDVPVGTVMSRLTRARVTIGSTLVKKQHLESCTVNDRAKQLSPYLKPVQLH